MYDGKSEPNEFVGLDRADAVAQAVRFFGVGEDALKVVEPNTGEVVGVGGRSVVIVVPKEAGAQPRQSSRDAEDQPRGDGRGRARKEDRRGRERRRDSHGAAVREVAEDEVAESRGTVKGEVGLVGAFLVGAIEKMGIGPFEIVESREGGYLVYEVSGPAAEALSAGDGRAAEALQLLANQAVKRGSDQEGPRIVVDAAGDVGRRERNLRRLAERASKRARECGRSVALDPMNPRDRRALHMAVRELEAVVTMSVGEGRYRQVVIVPESAPEYEEARRAAERIEAQREGN